MQEETAVGTLPILIGMAGSAPRSLLAAATVGLLALMGASPPAWACVPRGGLSEGLPDCRVYELVSPVEKDGADAIASGLPPTVQASASGSALAYTSVGSFAGSGGEGPVGNELPNAYLAVRSGTGWVTRGLSPPTARATGTGPAGLGYDFSEDLSRVVVKVPLQTLAPGAPEGVYNLYLRDPAGGFSLVTTSPPATALPGSCGLCFVTTDVPAFAGASGDFGRVIFEANESLASLPAGAPGGEVENLYESFPRQGGGVLRLVGVLPDGAIPPEGAQPGSGVKVFYTSFTPADSEDVAHAISEDGSRIVFQAKADGGPPAPEQSGGTEVYDRIYNPGGAGSEGYETVELSAPAPGAKPAHPGPGPARFWAATADGSRVFFTSSAELTSVSNTGPWNAGNDLYEYDLSTRTLTDLTPDSNLLDWEAGANVLGVVGASGAPATGAGAGGEGSGGNSG
ncbi:MAG TPA: hypothetical protein VGX16_03185 [Solirubrobacteraceae bacterium]|nr:hypothetical protein [Solirubrobacteraceae bacterium]